MPLVGILGWIADLYYLQGIKTNNFDYLIISNKLFPFDRNYAIIEAEWYLHNKIVNEKALIAINNALKIDPYSSKLWNMQMQYSSVLGDRQLASYSFKQLYKLSPNLEIVQELIKRGAKIKD